MTLFSKTVSERTRPGVRSDVEEKDYTFHVYARSEGVAGVVISDATYPALVAHQVLSKVLDEFLTKNPRSTFMSPGVTTVPFPELKGYLQKFQDPSQADSIMKVQRELDETKIVLHKTIESVLERGEKLDNLITKSEGLSSQSKMFYTQVRNGLPFDILFTPAPLLDQAVDKTNVESKQAKKQNSCCIVM